MLLIINNEDNAPLTLNSVQAYQLHTSLTAYLDSGKQYALFYGDSLTAAPAYDLAYFSDSIYSKLINIPIVKTEALPVKTKAMNTANNRTTTWLLWSVIIIVLALLLYFSFNMIKDISRKTNNNASL